MQGNIDFIGSLSGDISGGGGGGSDVTITPTLTSGTKIADYEIDGEGGSLYAPTPTSLTAELPLSISDNVISIDLSDYATQSDISDFITDTELNTILEDYTTYQYTESRYTPLATFNSYTISAESHFQRTLTAGANITIDPVTDTISASGGSSWDYSTTEVDTGQKWIDGKTIYCKTIPVSISGSYTTIPLSGVDTYIKTEGFLEYTGKQYTIPVDAYYENSNYSCSTYYDYNNSTVCIVHTAGIVTYYPTGYLTAYYTKAT